MKKINILKKNRDFDKVLNNKKKLSNQYFSLFYNKTNQDNFRIGIAVSKKCGNAVIRNKEKRRIRSIIDKIDNIKVYDYVLISKPSSIKESYEDKQINLEKLFKEVN